jgi:hypothetical protein
MTNAPSDSAVAATAFVSGFSRWYALGLAGASEARNAESSALRAVRAAGASSSARPGSVDGSIGGLLAGKGRGHASASPTACSPCGKRAT